MLLSKSFHFNTFANKNIIAILVQFLNYLLTVSIVCFADAQITNAFLYHKCVTGTMIAATILMNAIVSSPPALKIATLVPAESVFHGSGSVTVTTIVETKAMSRRVFVAITPAIVTRDFSVTPHASAFLSFGSVTEMPTVMTDRTKMWKFAQVRNSCTPVSEFFLCSPRSG